MGFKIIGLQNGAQDAKNEGFDDVAIKFFENCIGKECEFDRGGFVNVFGMEEFIPKYDDSICAEKYLILERI